MDAQTIEWSDVPFVLAVCETGSLSGAARKLGVNHSTVFRRVESLENRLGVTLFERLSHGYVMTAAGEYFLQHGQKLQERMTRIQRELSGQDFRLEGVLSVTTTDSLLYLLSPVFRDFQHKYPEVEMRLLTGTRPLDLMQRDADIALRPTQNPPEHWIGRNLLPVSYAVYAHSDYVKAMQYLPPERHRWLQLDDSLRQSPMNKVTATHKADIAPVSLTSSVMGMFDLARAGLGIAVLPCYLGRTCPELQQLHAPETKNDTCLWLLAHPDIRRSARVHAFFEFATVKIREGEFSFVE
ncbi:LysR family transcriptional regulator [Phaeobacter gallaeciensis]|uniref:LysR family transcriptional regulator n=1 Tax=Phaeobacter gallaeciensis TaxID=60890 RepID=UPI000BBB772A|nr:LysR family transcriptional regulator [Phaeobacter gallaeciensis]ATF18009.1 transcriptional regulator, LysR family [Phaeobacter gallaeciensis]ATF22118.1 transcriptional regulator, LysR family [Phaeobacter gallaeciensis]